MNKSTIRHRIERTKNKHSRAVFKDDTIIIRLAHGLSSDEEKEHIDDLLSRMMEQVQEEQKKIYINPFGALLDSGESSTITLANGKKYRFTLKPGKKTTVRKNTRGWTVTIGPKMRRSGLHRLLWKTLAQHEKPRLESMIRQINDETYGAGVYHVKVQFASSQWGSCSRAGTIMLNAALLFVDPMVLEYVIIHELAHRKRADHSPQYWAWVEWAMPNYKKFREKLCEYRLPSL